jgi:hypothetical protein
MYGVVLDDDKSWRLRVAEMDPLFVGYHPDHNLARPLFNAIRPSRKKGWNAGKQR